jgi:sorbitol/mannitol transport system permease protein
MALAVRRKGPASVGSRIEQGSWKRAVVGWTVGLLFFFPAFQLFITGFKTESAALNLPPGIIPVPAGAGGLPLSFEVTLQNYADVVARGFPPFFLHSLLVVAVSGVLVVALALPAAYALVWRRTGRSNSILFFFLSTKFLPAVGVIVPIFVIARDLKMIDNPLTLIVMYTAANLPIAIWMLRSFLDEIPKDVIDASRVDGANVRQEIFSIAVPMVRPGLVATMFITIIFAWNEFFFAVNLMATLGATVPMFMISFVTSEGLFYAKLAAAGTLAMLPVVILGWSAQRQLVRGLSLGAVK